MSENPRREERKLTDAGSRSVSGRAEPQSSERNEKAGKGSDHASDTPVAEWIVAGIGLVLVLGAIGYLLYQAVYGDHSSPEITVRVEAVTQTSNGFLVKFRAANQGGATAEGVVVQGIVGEGTEKAESSQTTIDYLPSHSERKGGLFFTQDPRQLELQIRAFGYQEP